MKLHIFMLILIMIFITSCQEDDSVIESSPEGSYTYQAYDTLGNIIVQGWLAFEIVDSSRFEGKWHLNNINKRDDVGLQNGEGELIGSIDQSSIWLNLNPGWADHNVFLEGTVQDHSIQGKWIWTTFIGVTNWGSFKAVKN